MSGAEVEAYLSHLAVDRKVATAENLQNLPGIQDPARIERLLDDPHEFDFRR